MAERPSWEAKPHMPSVEDNNNQCGVREVWRPREHGGNGAER